MCCTLFLNFWVAYIDDLLKAGADYGSAHELSKAHNIFRYNNLSGANSLAVCRLKHNSVSNKYLWALPIPTTFYNCLTKCFGKNN